MHINTVTVASMRQDGAAFKCTLPEPDGEVWMTIPDNMKGHVEWKKSYRIGWTKNPRKTGGFFYNLKQLQLDEPPPPGHNNPPPSNGNGQPVPHSYKDLDIATQAVAKIFVPHIITREYEGEITEQIIAEIMIRCENGVKRWWRSRNKAAPAPAPAPPPTPPFNDAIDDIGDTF